jgi:hypothetical protein
MASDANEPFVGRGCQNVRVDEERNGFAVSFSREGFVAVTRETVFFRLGKQLR